MVQWACLAGLFLVLTACGAEGTQGRLEVTVTEAGGGRLPCRVHLMVEGKPVYAPGLPRFERDPHFSCPGQFAADVPAGKVSLRIEALAQEDERAGGAILLFNLTEPILIEGVTRDCPSGFAYHERAIEQKAFIEVEKPFWWEAPVHVALGRVDTIGIVCNHFNRAGLLEGEAWGRPRDRARHPAGPLGFALNVMDLYYRHLNLGYQIAASAGSASGVLANPLGYNRAYVQLDRFGYDAWFDGLRQGRNFATMTSSSPPAGSQV
ncbi:MAG: hypothetical protein FJ290_21985 [Planctomycetes bacterium]|nr:hypothetical protein [Planctomycetota bacterium]